ncbi:MAG TPA: serine hydrolase domain-containing protein, partial [Gemmatimonadales bacterium]|nr:serine hydrolase domain-containing protein [Gemmatimonadales bacterium]
YGRRSLETGEPVTPSTAFAVGSVTKQFTVAAALLLMEEGKLALTDKVAKWYPAATRARDITISDLFHHVSGYTDYYPLDYVTRTMQRNISGDAIVKQYAGMKLDFEPGTRWSYSNTGFIMLGRIIERITGKPLGIYLKERIFTPLGMKHTYFEPDPKGQSMAQGYSTFALGPLEPAAPEGKGWTGGAGGIYSTAEDLAKWDIALMNGKVFKPATWQLVITPRLLNDSANSGYGGGQFIGARRGWMYLQHGGAVSGFIANNLMLPAQRSAFITLAASERGPVVGQLSGPIRALFYADSATGSDNYTPPPGSSSVSPVPVVQGPPAVELATTIFKGLQAGNVDRSLFTEEYNHFLTPAKAQGAKERLGALGEPTKVEAVDLAERGGMEVSVTNFTFGDKVVTALMYRYPDNMVDEYLLIGR